MRTRQILKLVGCCLAVVGVIAARHELTRDVELPKAWTNPAGRGQTALAFSPDSRFLLGRSASGGLLVWDGRTGDLSREIPGAVCGPVRDSTTHPRIAFAAPDRIWCLETGNTLVARSLTNGQASARIQLPGDVAIVQEAGDYRIGPIPAECPPILTSPDGATIAVGAGPLSTALLPNAPSIALLDVDTGKELQRFRCGPCAFTSQERLLIVAEETPAGSQLRVWSILEGREMGSAALETRVIALCVHPDAQSVTVCGMQSDGTPVLGIRRLPSLELQAETELSHLPQRVVCDREGRTLLVSGRTTEGPRSELFAWNGRTLHREATAEGLSHSPEANLVAARRVSRTAGDGRVSQSFEVLSLPGLETIAKVAPAADHSRMNFWISPDGRSLVVHDFAMGWSDIAAGTLINEQLAVYRLPGGTQFARMTRWQTMRFDGSGNRIVNVGGRLPPLGSVNLSADGGRLATVSQQGEVSVWKLDR